MPMLEHINLVSSNVDATIEFLLTAIPEWKIRGEGGSTTCPRWVHVGDEHTYIAVENRGDAGHSNHQSYHHVGLNHIGLVVENVSELAKRMRSKGYIEGKHVSDHPSRSRYYFFDHDGLEYEFVQYHKGKDKNSYDG